MIFSQIKTYLIGILGVLVAFLGFGLKVSGSRRKQAEKKLESAEAKVERETEINEKETELGVEYRSERAKIAKEIEEKRSTKELSEPNEW